MPNLSLKYEVIFSLTNNEVLRSFQRLSFLNKLNVIIKKFHLILYQIFASSLTKWLFFGWILISFCHYFSLTLILYTSSFTKYEKKRNKREQEKKRKRLRKQLVCIYVRVKTRKKKI